MKQRIIIVLFIFFPIFIYAQEKKANLKMISEYTESEELRDILSFEGINYFKIKFIGDDELRNKSYKITAKEFRDGELVSDNPILDSKLLMKNLHTVGDTILSISVIAKQTPDDKLKLMLSFPAFSINKEFDTIQTEDTYSLRNIANESKLSINYDEAFYFLAYILPYDMGNGYKSYCEVGINGKDAENWGKRFGIEHYILFEMKFESN